MYLEGAFELRNGVPNLPVPNTASPDTLRAMTPEMLFDYLAVRLNGPKAWGKKISLNISFTDLGKNYGLLVNNGVLKHGKPLARPDVSLTMSKSTIDAIQLRAISFDDAIQKGDIKVDGNGESFKEFLGLLDTFPFWFNIVTP